MSDLRPAVEFATGQQSIKGEDFMLVQPLISFPKPVKALTYSTQRLHLSDSASSQNGILGDSAEEEIWRSPSLKQKRSSEKLLRSSPSFGLYCVMDGHNGKAAAEHLQTTLKSTLEERMPPGEPPSETHEAVYRSWCDEIQRAIISTLTSVNEEFACRGQMAGTTVTVIVQCGWLLTVANLGDSKAILDTGNQHIDLSEDHRISTHQADRRRLEAMDAHIAPICGSGSGPASKDGIGYGPLRVWPGGSCLSRGIGDFDIGPPVIACPFIYQVRVPNTGGRVIVASDGVWDGFDNIRKLLKISRIYNCQSAPEKIIHCLKNAYGGLRDDTSLIVLDIMPPGVSFTDLASQIKKSNSRLTPRRSSSSGCLCFSGGAEMVKDDDEIVKPSKTILPPTILAQIDVAEAVGLMPQKNLKQEPAWCTEDFCETIRSSQEAACNAWQEARSIRSRGRTPSRMDLESFFSAVYHVKPLKDLDAKEEENSPGAEMEHQRHLDITTRPTSFTHTESDELNSLRKESPESPEMRRMSQENASTHFSEHVGQPSSYPRKFGLYKAHMLENGDEGSTTEDDSARAGSIMYSSPFGTPRKMSLQEDPQSPMPSPGNGSPLEEDLYAESSLGRRRRSHGSFELNGSTPLPTVEEEMPNPQKSHRLSDIVALEQNNVSLEANREATEMAVRRGKNRFTPPGALVTNEPKLQNGRPPLPSNQKHVSWS